MRPLPAVSQRGRCCQPTRGAIAAAICVLTVSIRPHLPALALRGPRWTGASMPASEAPVKTVYVGLYMSYTVNYMPPLVKWRTSQVETMLVVSGECTHARCPATRARAQC